jgi:hypothetical protein
MVCPRKQCLKTVHVLSFDVIQKHVYYKLCMNNHVFCFEGVDVFGSTFLFLFNQSIFNRSFSRKSVFYAIRSLLIRQWSLFSSFAIVFFRFHLLLWALCNGSVLLKTLCPKKISYTYKTFLWGIYFVYISCFCQPPP